MPNPLDSPATPTLHSSSGPNHNVSPPPEAAASPAAAQSPAVVPAPLPPHSAPQPTTPEALAIQAALHDCYDPSLPCNIVDLGFLTALTVLQDHDAPGATIPGVPPRFAVAITLTPTLEDDTTEAHLRAQVLNRLAGLAIVSRTTLTFRYTPAWSPLRITPRGRRLLGLDGNPTLIQIR